MLSLYNGFDRTFARELRSMDRMFNDLSRAPFRGVSWPRVDIVETKEALELTAEVPGFKASDVTVTLHDGELRLEGKQAETTKTEEGEPERRVLRRERQALSFTRTFTVNFEVDEAKVTAAVEDGVLTVVLPKAPAVLPKQIAVSGA